MLTRIALGYGAIVLAFMGCLTIRALCGHRRGRMTLSFDADAIAVRTQSYDTLHTSQPLAATELATLLVAPVAAQQEADLVEADLRWLHARGLVVFLEDVRPGPTGGLTRVPLWRIRD
jgi:hypothetical protein